MSPLITIIIPVRNESRFVRGTLDQLAGQNFPEDQYEIVVVDGMSDDGTPELVSDWIRDHPAVSARLAMNPRRLSSAARNVAIRLGQGNYFLVVDGHVRIPGPGMLQAAANLIRSTGARVLGRPQRLVSEGVSPFQRIVAEVRKGPMFHSRRSYIYSDFEGWVPPGSVAVMYHRDVFPEFGYFDEDLDAAEDYEFNYRLQEGGLLCYTSPALEVNYYPRDSFRGLFRQMIRYGLGQARMVRKHPRAFRVEQLAPALFAVGLPLTLVASMFWPILAAFWALGFLVYSATVLAYSGSAGRDDWRSALSAVGVALTIHIGLGVGLIKGLFGGRAALAAS